MQLLETLPTMKLKDSPEHRKFYSAEAMVCPGRMRVALALEALRFLCPNGRHRVTVLDIFIGVGTTLIAAALLQFEQAIGFDIDMRWQPEIVNMVKKYFDHIDIEVAQVDADEGTQYFFEECADVLFCSPEFPNTHPQGKGAMQDGYRKQKQTIAGTEFGSGKKWRGEKNFRIRLTAALTGSGPLVAHGGMAGIHIKNYVKDNKEVRVDLWTAEILEACGFEVHGYLAVPIADRSKFQADQRLPLRKILSTNEETLTDDLECGHKKVRKEAPAVWPKKARCVECGPVPGRIEVREERIVVAKRR